MDASFLPGSNPVLTRELRVVLRNARTFALLAIYVAILGAVVMAHFPAGQEITIESANSTDSGRIERGRELFSTFFGAQVVLVLVMVPGLATGALAQERERRTLEPLLLSPMTPLGIIWGKAAGVLALAGLLLLATLPLTSLCFVLGGVSPGELISAYAFLLGMALFTTGLGLYCAAKWPSTTQATLLCYAQLPILLALIAIFAAPGMLISGILIFWWLFYRMALWWKGLAEAPLPKALGPLWNALLWLTQGIIAIGLLVLMIQNYEIGVVVVGVLFLASYLVVIAYYILREAAREVAQKPAAVGPMRERMQDFKDEWQRAVATTDTGYLPSPTGAYSYSPFVPNERDPFASLAYDKPPDAPLPGMPKPVVTPPGMPAPPARNSGRATYGIEPFLSDKLNPIYAKDLRSGLLGKSEYFVRFAYIATIASELLVLLMVWNDTSSSAFFGFTSGWAKAHLLLLMTAGAWFGARGLAPEREQQTLPQLLTVPLPASAIVGGKMMAVMTYTFYVYLMALPLMLLLPAIGEMPWGATLSFLGLELVFGAFAAAWGLYCSIQAVTVRRALGWALGGILVLMLGGPMLSSMVLSGWGPNPSEDRVVQFAAVANQYLMPLPAMENALMHFQPGRMMNLFNGKGGFIIPFTPATTTAATMLIYALATAVLLFFTSRVFKHYAQSE